MRRTFGICFLVLLSAFCLWKYAERLTPMERLYSGNFSLEQLQREKCVIITDLCEIKKAELWEDFIKKVKLASDAKVRVLFVYSGEKEGSTLKGTVLDISYDGATFKLQKWSTWYPLEVMSKSYLYLKQCTTDIYNGVYSKHTIWVLTDDSSCEYGDIVRLQVSVKPRHVKRPPSQGELLLTKMAVSLRIYVLRLQSNLIAHRHT